MNAWMAFVSIIAIIAIVLVAGGIIAFLGHMIIGAFDSDKKTIKDVVEYPEVKQLTNTVETTKEYDFDAINYAKAEKEQELASKEDADFEEQFKLLEDEGDLEEIENRLKEEDTNEAVVEEAKLESTDDDFANIDDLLDEISNDVVDEEKDKLQEENSPKMSDELSAYSIDSILKEEELVEEDELSEAIDEENIDEDETEDDDQEGEGSQEVEIDLSPVEEEVQTSVEEENEDKKVIEDLKAQLAELNRQLEAARTSRTEVVTIDMTEEECLARLATLEERLKGVKKEYKINMKEYRPLKKVMNDLEKYQTKLRRKDTQVAKKKVALYGVNNYVDIDKEKAEKLSNELDLLDGLRLSVAHCEEVINANKDRFPILEHTNKILEDQIAHIEADIETTNLTLQKIREKQGSDGENNKS